MDAGSRENNIGLLGPLSVRLRRTTIMPDASKHGRFSRGRL